MAKTKSSKLRLTSKLRFDKSLLAVVAIVVTAVGGYFVYKSYAITYPPYAYGYTKAVNFTTTDGVYSDNAASPVAGKVYGNCMKYRAQSAFGLFTRCAQTKIVKLTSESETLKFRTVNHNFVTGKYTPDSDWISYTIDVVGGKGGGTPNPYYICKNTNNAFAQVGTAETGYGLVFFGQRYRRTIYGVWQVSLSNWSPITQNCTTSSTWFSIKDTW